MQGNAAALVDIARQEQDLDAEEGRGAAALPHAVEGSDGLHAGAAEMTIRRVVVAGVYCVLVALGGSWRAGSPSGRLADRRVEAPASSHPGQQCDGLPIRSTHLERRDAATGCSRSLPRSPNASRSRLAGVDGACRPARASRIRRVGPRHAAS